MKKNIEIIVGEKVLQDHKWFGIFGCFDHQPKTDFFICLNENANTNIFKNGDQLN